MAPRDGTDPFELSTLVCRDPATGERLGLVSIASQHERRGMVARAQRAQAAWATTSSSLRRRVAAAVVDGIVDRLDELCRLVVHGTGKTMVDALLGELLPACAALRRARPARSRRLSVIGVLGSQRYPLHDTVVPCVRALLDGSAVVLAPCAQTAWSCPAFAELVRDALRSVDADPELVAVVPGDDDGDRIACLRETGIDTVYEMRRSPRVLVVGDDDISTAVDAAMLVTFTPFASVVGNVAAVLVPASSYARFVAEARRRVAAMRTGPPLSAVDCGAVGPAACDAIGASVDDALAAGATLRVGGRRLAALGNGYFAPTLLEPTDLARALSGARTGDPILQVLPAADVASARALASEHESDIVSIGVQPGDAADADGTLGLGGLLPPSLQAAAYRALGPRPTDDAMLPVVLPYPVDATTYVRLEQTVRLLYGRGPRRRVRAAFDLTRHLWSTRSRSG